MPSALIVGCGVFGLSTALELANNDYEVTALDAYPVPSPWSAANDYNKIIRTEYSNPVYTKLAIEALEMWRTENMFHGPYNECGRLQITPTHKGRREFEEIGIKNLQLLGGGQKIERFSGGVELAARFPALKENRVDETTEFKWNPESGLGHAAHSLEAVYKAAHDLGVEFLFGEGGNAVSIHSAEGKDHVTTKDGKQYSADVIIVSMGASTGKLVDLKTMQSATGLFVTHIQLTDDEFLKYENIPIVFDSQMGYFFPPDPETHIMKICLSGSGAAHFVVDPFGSLKTRSLPRYKVQNPKDTIPKSGPKQAEDLLKKYIPELANHRLFDHKSCWIADTADSNFIIDKVPEYSNVYVATGDSGHAFKFLPNIGKYIRDRINGTLDKELAEMWRWKEDAAEFDASACPWRVLRNTLDFKDILFVEES